MLLTPLTTCHPTMVYTDEPNEYPTLDRYEKISARNISVSNASRVVVGVISEDELCLYDIILLTDTHGMQFMVEGVPQQVNVPANGTAYVLFNSRSDAEFEVQSTHSNIRMFAN